MVPEDDSQTGREEASSVATKTINSSNIVIIRCGNRGLTPWCLSTACVRDRYSGVRKAWYRGEDLMISDLLLPSPFSDYVFSASCELRMVSASFVSASSWVFLPFV